LGTVTLAGADPGDFKIVSDLCSNTTVPGNAGTCTFGIQYAPTVAGAASKASVSVSATNQAGAGGTASWTNINGTGANAATLSFLGGANQTFTGAVVQSDDYALNDSGTELSFTVQNRGGVPTALLTTTLPSDIFFVDPASSCTTFMAPNTTGLGGGGTCTFLIDMKATATTALGSHTTNFQVTAGSLSTATFTVTGAVSPVLAVYSTVLASGIGSCNGTGTCGTSGNPWDFGTTQSGSATIEFGNFSNGGYVTGLLETSLSDQSNFTIIADACAGSSLPAGSCNVTVLFNPQSNSASTATVTVTDTKTGNTMIGYVQGNP